MPSDPLIKQRVLQAFQRCDPGGTNSIDRAKLFYVFQLISGIDIFKDRFEAVLSDSGFPSGDPVPFDGLVEWICTGNNPVGLEWEAGHLCFDPAEETMSVAMDIINSAREGQPTAASIHSVLCKRGLAMSCARDFDSADTSGRPLMVIFTDFEIDDSMAIAQLWRWHVRHEEIEGDPLIIFTTNFASKDGGTVFEKKQLVAELMLGLSSYFVLPTNPPATISDDDTAMKQHPVVKSLVAARGNSLAAICDRLESFRGDCVNLYIMAPGYGNIGAVVEELKKRGCWPLAAKFRVSLYSGSFNVRHMEDVDCSAICEIMRHSCAPLVDVAKYPFFGGKHAHPWTDALNTFVLRGFAEKVRQTRPLLAVAMKLLNDELNSSLIAPGKDSLFKGSTLNLDERTRFSYIGALFELGDREDVESYAKALYEDEEIFMKVAGYKKSTVRAFVDGGCDSPLCDQLIFLTTWLQAHRPEWLAPALPEMFRFGRGNRLERADPGSADSFLALQLTLAKPTSEPRLMKLREVLDEWLWDHLDSLQCISPGAVSAHPSFHHVSTNDLIAWYDVASRLGEEAAVRGEAARQVLVRAVDMLRDSDADLRGFALRALKHHRIEEMVDGLLLLSVHVAGLAEEDSAARADAAWALGELGAVAPPVRSAVTLMMVSLVRSDNHEGVRAEAARAMGKLAAVGTVFKEAIVPILVEASCAFQRSPRTRAPPQLPGCPLCRAAVEALGRAGEARQAVPDLKRSLATSTSSSARRVAAVLLGKLGAAETELATEILPALVASMHQDDAQMVRQVSAQALGRVGAGGVGRRGLMENLGHELVKVLDSKGYFPVQEAAINALACIEEGCSPDLVGRIVSKLSEILSADCQWKVKVQAIARLESYRCREPLLNALCNDLNEDVRQNAAIALGRIRARLPPGEGEELEVELRAVLRTEPTEKVRASIKECCGEGGGELGTIERKNSCRESKYVDLDLIEMALQEGDTILIKGSWLLRQCATGRPLPKRQELPPEAAWAPDELIPKVQSGTVKIVAISYCWLTALHPDPDGNQLRKIGRVIEQQLQRTKYEDDYKIDDLAMFWDWLSLYQKPRSDAEDTIFKRALPNMGLWYAHQMVIKWLLTIVPADVRAYNDRGWPTFERSVSGLIVGHHGVLDLGLFDACCTYWGGGIQRGGTQYQCKAGRRPPSTPGVFQTEVLTKHFTAGYDKDFVIEKYETTFIEVMGSARKLSFARLGWGNDAAKRVAATLPYCTHLRDLYLDHNQVGDTGASELAEQLPKCGSSLVRLWLGGNIIGDTGARSLAEAMPKCRRLSYVGLHENCVGDLGLVALANAVKATSASISLWLGENRAGKAGAVALAEAVESQSLFVLLDLSKNEVGDEGATALASALPFGRLKTLRLNGSKVRNAAVRAITEAIPKCGDLECLGLANNDFGEEEGRSLYTAWTESRKEAKNLTLPDPASSATTME